jgi:hypothetical protein
MLFLLSRPTPVNRVPGATHLSPTSLKLRILMKKCHTVRQAISSFPLKRSTVSLSSLDLNQRGNQLLSLLDHRVLDLDQDQVVLVQIAILFSRPLDNLHNQWKCFLKYNLYALNIVNIICDMVMELKFVLILIVLFTLYNYLYT